MPKLSKLQQQQRRKQILRAAETCFAKRGFQKTTIPEICAEGGFSTGALYTYFSSKDDLIDALLDQAQAIDRRLFSQLARAGLDDLTGFLNELRWLFTRPGRNHARLDIHLWAQALHSSPLRDKIRQRLGRITQLLRPVIRDGQQMKRLSEDLDDEALASVWLACLMGLEMQRALGVATDMTATLEVVGALLEGDLGAREEPV